MVFLYFWQKTWPTQPFSIVAAYLVQLFAMGMFHSAKAHQAALTVSERLIASELNFRMKYCNRKA
ncbi:MAG: hypothetical protein FWC40_03120 [Proteobacteria bacterium]|nr:hypothetical protein [Pseudomonadota bacterium]MCL2325482.1 hypothetical protein [Pseudomonadota bacterium]